MRSNQNQNWERPVNYTYMNDGSSFTFRVDKMTRHPYKAKGATMLKVHALLTLEGQDDGKNVELLDTSGQALSREDLEYCARTGEVPPVEA